MAKRSNYFCVFVFLFGLAGPACDSEASDNRPNVIVVLTDDQGYGDMSCHGNPFLKTPEIDRLAADSVRLTDFHVDPTCSPTRAALLTGRYSTRVGVWLTYGSRHHLHQDEVTLADVFQENGYKTAIFGKWHLGDNYPFRPTDRGFDESLIHGGGMVGETPDFWNNDYYDDTYFRNGVPEMVRGYCTDVWFDEAKKFIDRNRNQPFFLYLATNAPHGPLHVPEKYTQRYRNKKGISRERAYFYGMIDCIDHNLGELRGHLVDAGIADNTIIVFMNDNGTGHGVSLKKDGKPNRDGWEASGFNAGLRGRKASAFEGGHRAACFIHWANGKLRGGRDLDGLTAHIDVMPTLIDLCDLELRKKVSFDGESLGKQLSDPSLSIPQRTLFVHHQGRFGKPIGDAMPIKGKDYSVMQGRWRLVGGELFDIKADPSQWVDVSQANAAVKQQLQGSYERWWQDISKTFNRSNAFIVDPTKQAVVIITSQNFLGGRVAYSQHHVRNAMDIGECYALIDVQKPGRYRVTVRRWPKEVNRSFSETVEGHQVDPLRHEIENRLMRLPSKAIPASKVRLKVGGFEATTAASANASEVNFEVDLATGVQRISATLIDSENRPRSAYYIYITSSSSVE